MSAFPVPDLRPRLRVLAGVVVLLSGCSTSQIDSIPQAVGGLPEGAPARAAEAPAFPAVHEMPPQRTAAILDAEQQKKLEADLIAIRNRQPNQQKNIARAKEKAEKEAKKKADKANKPAGGKNQKKKEKKPRKPAADTAAQPAASGQAASGTPPWPAPR